ncbi:hypothetical protein BURPS668_A0539 [Burkholderia pseudomallei 668]|nr:hypothetical protein BURPS668_A0539 [Burkholderia pseudomallei 668]
MNTYPTPALRKFLSFEMPGAYVQSMATIAKPVQDMRKPQC